MLNWQNAENFIVRGRYHGVSHILGCFLQDAHSATQTQSYLGPRQEQSAILQAPAEENRRIGETISKVTRMRLISG